MQVAFDSFVYFIVGVISISLLLIIAKSINPYAFQQELGDSFLESVLRCYKWNECGFVYVKNASSYRELLDEYKVRYLWNCSCDKDYVILVKEGDVVVING